MGSQPSITNADDRKLIELIGQAEHRVVFMAPGISESVAKSLADVWNRLGAETVSVILDVDPEVCRLGYGTIEGLQVIEAAAAQHEALICHQPGVRIGLLIADDATLIYAPTPLLVEAGSRRSEHPNAIQLGTPPTELARDVGLGANPAMERSVGMDQVPSSRVEAVAADLRNNPPAKFDLARKVRVFTSHFQFVELEMTGCYISRKKVPIPSSLVGLANERDVQSQFHAQFNLVSNVALKARIGDRELAEKDLHDRRALIVRDFLVPLKGYGNIILRSNKGNFIKAVEHLRAEVALFQQGIRQQLQAQMDLSADTLVSALGPAVRQNPPLAYTKVHGPEIDEQTLHRLLSRDIQRAFGRADDLVEEMTVRLVFKDVTYESLVDPNFLTIARKAMPDLAFLHDEFDAARGATVEQPTLFDN